MKTFNLKQSNLTATLSKKSVAFLATTLIAGGLFATATTASADQVTYVVKPGDTLSQISDKFYNDQTHIQSIAKTNNISNIAMIYVGESLTFNTDATSDTETPAKSAVAQAAATPAPTANIATGNGFTANSAKEAIAMTESGGSYSAQNGQYYGRYQLTSSYLGGDFSPANQERVADNYVAGRYGSWEAAWQFHLSHGWY
ncbi:LysM peptidoglycan-binding domain-containing protein [Lactococcus piscium]|uniref:aggregation-promoting factor n=1 Tax=Pseudolactococcus carnosus TaxID=2749961 RepID=UPI001FBC0FD0|nr:LysM peptidoglycan-binding domain-containing protein [Lactococcus carnosus]MCJ1996716.1 LysM peptidoglycan-binding domain-containing protein [Lactococcus carnosus]